MPKIIADISQMHKNEWLMLRKNGIGGSDAAAILGLNPYSSAYSVYMDKITSDIDDKDNDYMRIGRDLEDYVAKRFEEDTGREIRKNDNMMAHDDYDFIFADIDRELVNEDALLECKISVRGRSKDWDEQIPLHYEIQCLHYLGVTGYQKCYLAVLFLSTAQFRVYEINRDQQAIDNLYKRLKDFWHNNVLARKEPEFDGSTAIDNILNQKYVEVGTEDIILPEGEYLNKLETYDDLKEKKALIEKNIKIVEQQLKDIMKEHQTAFVGERKVTWKQIETNRLDTKKLKEERPELYKAYSNASLSRRFTIN